MQTLFYAAFFAYALIRLAPSPAGGAAASLAPPVLPWAGPTAPAASRREQEGGGAALSAAILRTLDIMLSLTALLLLLPALLVIGVLIWADSPGPVFYRRRVLRYQGAPGGSAEATFDAFKFRSMVADADARLAADPALRQAYEREYKLPNDPRVTRIGAVLRAWSLDELPQLVNVLRGQMSLVGPRILSPPELARYGDGAPRLLSVKPGLTGLWQVSGRHRLTYAQRVRLDLWYVQHRSLRLDLAILARTIGCVLSRTGAF